MSLDCLACEDNHCYIYSGQRFCPQHCERELCFCIRCQLEQVERSHPSSECQRCDFLSECYTYTYIGQVIEQSAFVLHRYCVETLSGRTLSSLSRNKHWGIGCNQLMNNKNVNTQEGVDIYEQGVNAKQLTSSVGNDSRQLVWVRVQVETDLLQNWISRLSIYPNRQFGYSSLGIFQPVWIGRVVRVSPCGCICRFI